MITNQAIHSNLAIPPGEYLEEVLDDLGMTKNELARRMGRPASKLSPIFKGEKAITPDTALQLERVVGVPAHIWIGLESEYRLTLARQAETKPQEQVPAETALVKKFCYHELVQAGEVKKHSHAKKKVSELRSFFGVMSLESVLALPRYQAAFRYGKAGQRSPEAVAAWLRLGERRAQRLYCAPFNENRLRTSLDELRAMTLQPPENFQKDLQAKLAAGGVALIICPHFPKTKAHGATFRLGRDKAVLMITIRGKWADIFWFSLFHEIGHILLHKRQAVILEDDSNDHREKEADAFAANALIPPEAYKQFVERGRFYPGDIKSLAQAAGIHPGIVVGRLQHEKLLPPQYGNDLRERYEWAGS